MTTFNQNFFQANRNYTREMAETKLIEKGYLIFSFDGCSFENGASFYFTLDNGKKVRVSDHELTGKRAFDTIQIRFVEPKIFESKAILNTGIVYKKKK